MPEPALTTASSLTLMQLHDVLDKVGNTGVWGAVAAGLPPTALFAGIARLKRHDLPANFPKDPEAAQAKYALAYSQLEEAIASNPGGAEDLINALKGRAAAQLSLSAFVEARVDKLTKDSDKKTNRGLK
jgi:hypothetical protein